jgi:DNA ligase-associated metallophosphoesterase
MKPYLQVSRSGQTLWLSAEKCLFWEEKRMLILSDLHIGKAAHFRKSGIAVPGQLFEEDMKRIDRQIDYFQPHSLLVTGDFFHSVVNDEHERFRHWRTSHRNLQCRMVRGNHEVLSDQSYSELGIEVLGSSFTDGPFCFVHEKPEELPPDIFSFSGHVHPGIRLTGTGKQAIALPCFYFAANYCILPAFSRFTGKYLVQPEKGHEVYAIVQENGVSSLVMVN